MPDNSKQASKRKPVAPAKKGEPVQGRVQEVRHPETHDWPSSLVDLRRQMDDLFEDFLAPWRGGNLGRRFGELGWPNRAELAKAELGGLVALKIDVSETDKAVEISAELPGLEEKDVEVNLQDDVLTIKGEKREEKKEEKKNFYLSERRFGSFHRSFRLPETLDTAKVEARFDKGVLRVTVPKRPEAKKAPAKKVPIKK
jgi:HSP20 family protein